jgi:hypothetical protein
MKKSVLCTILFALAIAAPISAMAQVGISVGIALPPPIVFQAPPNVVVLPDTPDVYAVPDVGADLFFYNGWWWYLWEGRWYRSHYYDRGWAYFDHVPRFYFDVDPGWRGYYRDHNWRGQPWDYQRIPNGQLQQNWKGWHANGYWQRQKAYGVQGYQPRPQREQQAVRQQRQQQYQQRPEVQRQQQQRPVQRQPQAQQPQRQQQQRQPQAQRPPQQHAQPGGQQQRSQGKPERGEEEHRK